MAIINDGVTIDSGLEASVMRRKMESKDTLATKGALYVGTGTKEDSFTVTKSIAPNGASDNGKVLVADASEGVGWKVAKITTANLEGGRVEQATNAEKADAVSYNGDYKSFTDAFTDAFVSACLLKIYPVGSIYMSANNVNPSTFLGGTWEAWGAGRVPVGVDASDADFATVEKTGGEKTHTLNSTEIPNHTHSMLGAYDLNDAGTDIELKGELAYMGEGTSTALGGTGTLRSAAISHSGLHGSIRAIGLLGESDKPHNNLQPYITCYMWKRTA